MKIRQDTKDTLYQALMELHHDRQDRDHSPQPKAPKSTQKHPKESTAPQNTHAEGAPLSTSTVDDSCEQSEPSEPSSHLSSSLNPWKALGGCYVTDPLGAELQTSIPSASSKGSGSNFVLRTCLNQAHSFVAFWWRSGEHWCTPAGQRSDFICRQTKRHARIES